MQVVNGAQAYRADFAFVLVGDGATNGLVGTVVHYSLFVDSVGRIHERNSSRNECHTNGNKNSHNFQRGHDWLPSLQFLLTEIVIGGSVGLHWLFHVVGEYFIGGRYII